MSLKVANVRLELDDAEEALPAKISERLGVGREAIARWRILRKSLDARRHDDLHFVYSAEVELPEGEAQIAQRGPWPDVERFEAERFEWPEPGSGRLEHRPVVIGAGPAGLFAGYLLALDGYRPLVLERGREVKDRVADVRRFDAGGPLDPESNYLFGEGGGGTLSGGKVTSPYTGPGGRGGGRHVQRRQAHLAEYRAGRPEDPRDPGRLPRQAVDRLRAPAPPRLQSAASGGPDPEAEVRGAGGRDPVFVPGRGPRPRRRRASRPPHELGARRGRRRDPRGRPQRTRHLRYAPAAECPARGQAVPVRRPHRAAAGADRRRPLRSALGPP